tara:strand:+ start:99412 stop:100143 length:732 start_codon:yes stop_codon:yes gene_type:complete
MPEFENIETEKQTQYSPSDEKKNVMPAQSESKSTRSSRSNMRSRWKKRGAQSSAADQPKATIGEVEDVKALKESFKKPANASAEKPSNNRPKAQKTERKPEGTNEKQRSPKKQHAPQKNEAKAVEPAKRSQNNKSNKNRGNRSENRGNRSGQRSRNPRARQNRPTKKQDTSSFFATVKRVFRAIFGIEEEIIESTVSMPRKQHSGSRQHKKEDGSRGQQRRSGGQHRRSRGRRRPQANKESEQ